MANELDMLNLPMMPVPQTQHLSPFQSALQYYQRNISPDAFAQPLQVDPVAMWRQMTPQQRVDAGLDPAIPPLSPVASLPPLGGMEPPGARAAKGVMGAIRNMPKADRWAAIARGMRRPRLGERAAETKSLVRQGPMGMATRQTGGPLAVTPKGGSIATIPGGGAVGRSPGGALVKAGPTGVGRQMPGLGGSATPPGPSVRTGFPPQSSALTRGGPVIDVTPKAPFPWAPLAMGGLPVAGGLAAHYMTRPDQPVPSTLPGYQPEGGSFSSIPTIPDTTPTTARGAAARSMVEQAAATPAAKSPSASATAPAMSPSAAMGGYRVKKGDTLSDAVVADMLARGINNPSIQDVEKAYKALQKRIGLEDAKKLKIGTMLPGLSEDISPQGQWKKMFGGAKPKKDMSPMGSSVPKFEPASISETGAMRTGLSGSASDRKNQMTWMNQALADSAAARKPARDIVGAMSADIASLGRDEDEDELGPYIAEEGRMPKLATRGKKEPQKMARGGGVFGGIPGKDSVPMLGKQGEYVLPTDVVSAIQTGAPPPSNEPFVELFRNWNPKTEEGKRYQRELGAALAGKSPDMVKAAKNNEYRYGGMVRSANRGADEPFRKKGDWSPSARRRSVSESAFSRPTLHPGVPRSTKPRSAKGKQEALRRAAGSIVGGYAAGRRR